MTLPDLRDEHLPNAIRVRLEQRNRSYLSSMVLGGVDGSVTTFAIVAGAVGGGLSSVVIIVLGFANLVADGFSMAVSNYNAAKSQVEQLARARKIEGEHIDRIPEGEREEVRQILKKKGLEGAILEKAVAAISSDRRLWVDTMLAEEWGLQVHVPSPLGEGLVVFVAFCLFGFLPLTPFVFLDELGSAPFTVSIFLTGIALGAVGALKGFAVGVSVIRSGLTTLVTGATAAALAYTVGALLRLWLAGA
jgi:VIT1/CCC1 family predicted Fe2+/Mn2+ transporter